MMEDRLRTDNKPPIGLKDLLARARSWNPLVRRRAAHGLTRFDWGSVPAIEAVGLLAEALPASAARPLVLPALQRALSKVEPQDAGLLTSEQRDCLHRVLAGGLPGAEADFLIALVRAVWTMRDFDAGPALVELIERCAARKRERSPQARGESGERKEARLLATARVALKNLEHQAAAAGRNAALLRPISWTESDSRELLRPASSSSAESSDAAGPPDARNPEDT